MRCAEVGEYSFDEETGGYRGPERYEEKLERWKEEWNREIDDDLANGR
jgi:hypothetical protein